MNLINLTSLKEIKELFSKYGAEPSKGLGQNFLIDQNVLKKIINSADLEPDDVVLEVGPGIGTLTKELAKYAKNIIAVEKDKKMVNILANVLNDSNIQNVQIINADILKLLTTHYKLPTNYKVVANIPYYLTSPLIRRLLESEKKPDFMVLMLQKEVAQRICAKPPNMSILSVSVQFYAEPKIVSYVSKNCFWPAPKVDSAIIKITPRQTDRRRVSIKLFFKIVKAGFSQPRKQLQNNLSKALKLNREKANNWLLKNNIKPAQRAETLSVEDWKNLANYDKI